MLKFVNEIVWNCTSRSVRYSFTNCNKKNRLKWYTEWIVCVKTTVEVQRKVWSNFLCSEHLLLVKESRFWRILRTAFITQTISVGIVGPRPWEYRHHVKWCSVYTLFYTLFGRNVYLQIRIVLWSPNSVIIKLNHSLQSTTYFVM